MSTDRSFQRNARGFAAHLSDLLTHTITPHHPLRCQFRENNTARIRFQNGYAPVGTTCVIRLGQLIGPNPHNKQKVTTLEYLYALIIGADPEAEPLVWYEYVPMEAAKPEYPYAAGHVHINATAPDYDQYITPYEKKPLRRVHFPTGRIAIEDFIELLIVEFHVPVVHGDEQVALRLLRESRDTFRNEKQTKR